MASIEDFEDQFENPDPNFGNDLKTLPDGEYTFTVAKAVLKKIEKTDSDVVDLLLEVTKDGQFFGKKFRHTYWLTNKDTGELQTITVNILRGDLEKLGFDVKEWTKANGRPFLSEMKKAFKLMEKGVGFKAGKSTKDGKYAQLYVKERLTNDGLPVRFTKEELAAAVKVPFNADDYS